jgi:sulfoxide reductase catalytic subunit YedY
LESQEITMEHKSEAVNPSEITPESVYRERHKIMAAYGRRDFLKTMGALGAGALLVAACGSQATVPVATPVATLAGDNPVEGQTSELGEKLNTYEQITNYNNYYEFTTDKSGVAGMATDFQTSPWQVEVYGLVNQTKTFAIEDLLKKFPAEERIYRLRCVEGWSMVIPWQGFPLSGLLKEVEPLSSAKYVRFESIIDPGQMPGQKSGFYPWPYQEGLRLDEAMNDLTLLATGLYGKPLPNQDGAPLRLVVPWKYGFKSLKAIVKIELVAEQPETFWNTIAPNEYGFYSNVNPDVPHPRWSQSTERRIGESGRRKTLMFNGYADQVAHLYDGMDLSVDF